MVILDNLGSRKGNAARQAFAPEAYRIFLPAYSPDLCPIEQVLGKPKGLLRAAEPRDLKATWQKIGELLDLFCEEECINYVANSGYSSAPSSLEDMSSLRAN